MLAMAPPEGDACVEAAPAVTLPVKVLAATDRVDFEELKTAPPENALLVLNVLLFTIRIPPADDGMLMIAPPSPLGALLELNILLMICAVIALAGALAIAPPLTRVALLFVNVQPLMNKPLPALRMAPAPPA